MTAAKADRLELERDESFHRWDWRSQRIGWILWGLVLAAAVAGLVGPGLFSATSASSADGAITVAYDRFAHFHHPTTLDVTLRPASSTNELQVTLPQSYLDRVQLVRVQPEPERQVLTTGGAVLIFARNPTADEVKFVLHIEHEYFGKTTARFELSGHEPVHFTQYVYP